MACRVANKYAVSLYLDPETLEKVDEARGEAKRSTFLADKIKKMFNAWRNFEYNKRRLIKI